MPFGFCHEMIKGFVVTAACWVQGTRIHSAGRHCLDACGGKKGGSFWWKHLSGIHQVSSAIWSLTSLRCPSKWSWVLCFPLKTLESCSKTKATEGCSTWTKLSDSGPSKRKICTHHCDSFAPRNCLCCLLQTNHLYCLISMAMLEKLRNNRISFCL